MWLKLYPPWLSARVWLLQSFLWLLIGDLCYVHSCAAAGAGPFIP